MKKLPIILLLFLGACQTSAYVPMEVPSDYEFHRVVLPEKSPIINNRNIPLIEIDQSTPIPVKSTPKPKPTKWHLDREVSWYGPGFYGNRTACGLAYTKTLLGVAHRSLPCGTKVTFMWKDISITVSVIDRGPYVRGRRWDLSGGLCVYLNHCFTGPIYYRVEK